MRKLLITIICNNFPIIIITSSFQESTRCHVHPLRFSFYNSSLKSWVVNVIGRYTARTRRKRASLSEMSDSVWSSKHTNYNSRLLILRKARNDMSFKRRLSRQIVFGVVTRRKIWNHFAALCFSRDSQQKQNISMSSQERRRKKNKREEIWEKKIKRFNYRRVLLDLFYLKLTMPENRAHVASTSAFDFPSPRAES